MLKKEQALQKLKHYCSYQERCHAQAREKLYSLGMWKRDVELILSQLIEEDYLNEERFSQQFAGGKFRMKQWGRIKIKYELRQKGVSDYCISKAMKEIDESEYHQTLSKLATSKWKSLKSEKNVFVRKGKTSSYLLQKGYEPVFVNEILSKF